MKSMLKSELADLAGVSNRTFQRWLKVHTDELSKLGVTTHAHLIHPQAVRWIAQQYGIDIE